MERDEGGAQPQDWGARANLAMAMVIVGSSVVVGRVMVSELPVHLASVLRYVIAVALLVPLARRWEGGLPRLSLRSWPIVALQALCGGYLFNVLVLYGLSWTDPASAGVIMSTTPACMGILSWVLLRERPGRGTVMGIVLATAGVLCLNLPGAGSGGLEGNRPWLGNAMVLGAVACESLFLLLRRAVPEPVGPLGTSLAVSLLGGLYFLPLGVIEGLHMDWTAPSMAAWWSVAYYGVVFTVLAYIFWFRGIVRVTASTAGIFTGFMPVTAVLLSAVALDRAVGVAHVAGCALVLGAVVCISGVGKKRKPRTG